MSEGETTKMPTLTSSAWATLVTGTGFTGLAVYLSTVAMPDAQEKSLAAMEKMNQSYNVALKEVVQDNAKAIDKMILSHEKGYDRITTGLDGLRQDLRELKYGKGASGP